MPTGLWDILHDVQSPPTESIVKSYMRMLLKGVHFLHDTGIMHRVNTYIYRPVIFLYTLFVGT